MHYLYNSPERTLATNIANDKMRRGVSVEHRTGNRIGFAAVRERGAECACF